MLFSASAAFMLASDNNNKFSEAVNNNTTELYIFVPNTTDQKVALMPDGLSFNYTPIDTKYGGSINDSLNISLAIINHEGHNMNYTILVYQTESDIKNPTSNITTLYNGATRMMYDNDTLISWIRILPAYANDSTRIGVALLQDLPDGNWRILNNSEVEANIST